MPTLFEKIIAGDLPATVVYRDPRVIAFLDIRPAAPVHILIVPNKPIPTADDIAVAVKDGVVTLSGYVSSYYEKDVAEKAVKRLYGVKAVANDIEVKSTFTRTDPEIARDAVREIESHSKFFDRA